MKSKKLIPCIYLSQGKAVSGFRKDEIYYDGPVKELAASYGNYGADELLVFDFSSSDAEHDQAIGCIKEIAIAAEVPVIGAGNIKRMEDVKKLLYAGCQMTILNFAKESNCLLLEEVSNRFGKEKMAVYVPDADTYRKYKGSIENLASVLVLDAGLASELLPVCSLPILMLSDTDKIPQEFLHAEGAYGVTGSCVSGVDCNLMEQKHKLKDTGIPVNTFESSISWSEFKTGADGLVPVVVQDYKTDEVLMLAYMNEDAFSATLKSGRMTYWSRSRQELWEKGLTSGHFQYVKKLMLDCDGDTILAKVSQVGAACHTGNRSCFFKELVSKEYDDTNPLKVFQDVYDVILDRKIHPKEGSYTNYLFDKGIDKILKKVGEECTEIVIAAKNPDKEEIKYEISDFLYHVMVLMAEKDVTWDEITRELARR